MRKRKRLEVQPARALAVNSGLFYVRVCCTCAGPVLSLVRARAQCPRASAMTVNVRERQRAPAPFGLRREEEPARTELRRSAQTPQRTWAHARITCGLLQIPERFESPPLPPASPPPSPGLWPPPCPPRRRSAARCLCAVALRSASLHLGLRPSFSSGLLSLLAQTGSVRFGSWGFSLVICFLDLEPPGRNGE